MDNQILQEEKEINEEVIDKKDEFVIREMMNVGLMYGHKKSKTNPKFKKYINITRNETEIIDLSQTLLFLDSAIDFMRIQIKEGKTILFVASQPAAREAVEKIAKKFNFSFINEKWIGGLLTNFKSVSGRIEHFKKVQDDFEKGKFDKYTKKERVMINRDIERMRKMFNGLENLTKLPDVVFIIDPSLKGHMAALRETKKINIPVIAILDSDDDPEKIDFPIPANDHTKIAIDWIINKIEKGLEDNK
ncbi:30S ribosomal protein S2 [Candidatus Wolfebacteria bacterium]|nr:30S ribosomal protein S2 [Candidatus Wolfebacteria bacterium]